MRKIVLVLCVLCLAISQLSAQTRTVTGRVTDDKGTPLRGVTVREVSPEKKVIATAVTSEAGVFSIKVSDKARNLQFSSVGFMDQSQSVVGLKGSLDVKLLPNVDNLAEVVVTTAGGLKTRRKDQGYASTQISSAQLTAAKPTSIAAGLAGKVAGLNISATNGGVNPSFRIVLRGQRSLTGNNQALIVVDNIVTPSEILGNLNPEDVEDVVVLNGAGAAALYGSEASNGAILITTKKGGAKGGKPQVTVGHTITRESVSFFPKLQQQFGSGSTANFPIYTPDENQQYGPAFDGVLRPVGQPLADGSIQMLPYSPVNGKNSFWVTGVVNQTDVSMSTSDDKGSLRLSAQYIDGTTTTPKDKFNKAIIKLGGKRQMSNNLELSYAVNYTQNRYDITSQTPTIYAELMQTPAQIQVTDYKDWKTNKFATPDGYYNPFYRNPYFYVDNYRQYTRNDYLTANADLKYSPASWVDITWRNAIATRNNTVKSTSDKYTYSDFTKATTHGSYKKADINGSVGESSLYTTRLTTELQAAFRKKVNDFNLRATVGGSIRQDQRKDQSVSVAALAVPGVFNITTNQGAPPTGSEASYKARQMGLYGDVNIGYKSFINLHATGRNDWVSTLREANWSFFYPAVDVAFSPMEAIPSMKNISWLSQLKLRGGWSKVGQVNLPGNYGAYALDPVFNQVSGYPYTSGAGFSLDNGLVSPDLKPEITKGYELGFDASFFKSRVNANVTYYSTVTDNQTVTTSISRATGYGTYLLNAASTNSRGLEVTLNTTVLRNRDWELNVGAVYTHVFENNVLSIFPGIPNLQLSGGSYAVEGQPFPVIYGTVYSRDPQGRVIVDGVTGAPQRSANNAVLGNTLPRNTLGLNFQLGWKGLRLTAQAEYRGNYVTLMNNTTAFDFSGGGLATVAYNRDRFVFPNSSYADPAKPGEYIANTNITVRDGGYNFWTQTVRTGVLENYVASGAFWKLREVTLSYDVPESFLRKVKFIKRATIGVQGRNLVMLLPKTNLYTDPEYSDAGSTSNAVGTAGIASPPPSRFFGGTISITF